MLIYKRSNNLVVIRYYNFDFVGYIDDIKSTSDYIFMMVGGAVS